MQGIGVLRQQTKDFIEENPTSLVVTRNTRVSDGAGGYTTTPQLQTAQVVRIVQAAATSNYERRNLSGEVVRPVLSIVAEYDANLALGDTFTWLGRTCEIVWITLQPYEQVAEVSLR